MLVAELAGTLVMVKGNLVLLVAGKVDNPVRVDILLVQWGIPVPGVHHMGVEELHKLAVGWVGTSMVIHHLEHSLDEYLAEAY